MCHAWRVSGDWELLACFTRLGTAGVFHEAKNCWRVSRGWKLLACFTRLGTAGVFHETGNCWPACFTRLGTAGQRVSRGWEGLHGQLDLSSRRICSQPGRGHASQMSAHAGQMSRHKAGDECSVGRHSACSHSVGKAQEQCVQLQQSWHVGTTN
jgi:hypothetical protein